MLRNISETPKVVSVGIVFMMIISLFIGSGFYQGNNVAADPILLDLPLKINEINDTLQEYQLIICEFKGEEGISSKAINASEQITEIPIFLCTVFEDSILRFQQFPELNNIAYEKLNGISIDLDMLDTDFTELDSSADTIKNDESGMLQYIDVNYDKEDYTEETLGELVDELMNDTEYRDMVDSYLAEYMEYAFDNLALTDEIMNISDEFLMVMFESFAYLEENETIEPPDPPTSPESIPSPPTEPSRASDNGRQDEPPQDSIQQLDDHKLINHNRMLGWTEAQEGWEANDLAADAEIEQLRIEFFWHRMDLDPTIGERWAWEEGTNNWDVMDKNMGYAKQYGQSNMLTLNTWECPQYFFDDLDDLWDDYWEDFPWWIRVCKPWFFTRNRATLFASFGDFYDLGNEYEDHSPQNFVNELLKKVDSGQGTKYNIRSLCMLNEPNTIGAGVFFEEHFQILLCPFDNGWVTRTITVTVDLWFGTITRTVSIRTHEILLIPWTTINLIDTLLTEAQDTIDDDCINLNDVRLVVNLFSWMEGWYNPIWLVLARHQDLDVLGIDLYWDQPHCVVDYGDIDDLDTLATTVLGKEWWVVEMPGGENPIGKRPFAVFIWWFANDFQDLGANVVGFYRLWGIEDNIIDYGGAYNTWEKDNVDDNTPTARQDDIGCTFWVWISWV